MECVAIMPRKWRCRSGNPELGGVEKDVENSFSSQADLGSCTDNQSVTECCSDGGEEAQVVSAVGGAQCLGSIIGAVQMGTA
jgi:hypothetical protein